ncbi:MAG TPA: CHAT domain-containing protein [Ktedonosporobacter sp.]|nr:CHAT domain-containing protein [Ktedonosporobacter sp.]
MDLQRLVIDVRRVSDQEWSVSIRPADPEHPAGPDIYTRSIRRSTAGMLVFPQPPEAELEAMPPAPQRVLCSTTTLQEIEKLYRAIIGRQPSRENKDVEVFGRYLSATLLGPGGWEAINAYAGDSPIELALRWEASEHELARLPWEMMYGTTNFLSGEPTRLVAITRLVVGTAQQIDPLPSPLKVLFVVGTDLNKLQIRPGAEYLGLLRRLEATGKMSFQSRILLAATSQDLENEIKQWRPSVVHFICHGGNDAQGRRGYLELMNEDQKGRNPIKPIFAESLLPILLGGGPPPLVVLNACYSGKAATQEAVPLAVELVKGGIPIVVGMAGRVADRACRLFTHCFYEALLMAESLVTATAEGRCAGFMHIGDPLASVDWAFPTVFLAEGVSPRISIDPQERDNWSHLQEVAQHYYTLDHPPVFCDRLVFIEAYQRLISEKGRHARHAGIKVLGIEAKETVEDSKYGKTCLLRELAVRAVRDGHVPCLISNKYAEPPATPLALAWGIMKAMMTTSEYLQFPKKSLKSYECYKLKQLMLDPQADVGLDAHVNEVFELQGSSVSLEVVAAALHRDLKDLSTLARQRFSDAKVLILIDDAHLCRVEPRGQAALDLLLHLFSLSSLACSGSPFRIVFTYSRPTRQECMTASNTLFGVISNGLQHIEYLQLGEFRGPGENQPDEQRHRHDEYHLTYQQFLLGHNLVVAYNPLSEADASHNEEQLYVRLHQATEGIPSRFQYTNSWLKAWLAMATDVHILDKANDDAALDLMRKLAAQKGGM